MTELYKLLTTGKSKNIQKGQVIQSTDDQSVFNLIQNGYVKRYLISNEGNIGVQVVYGPGDIFPLTLAYGVLCGQFIYEGPETYYYEAITSVDLVCVDTQTMAQKAKENPLIYRGLFIEAGKRLRSTLNGLENVTLKTSYKRVAHQLAYLAREFGDKNKAGLITIKMPLTQQDIADILSTSRETVSLSIVQLREKGLVKTGRQFVIPNLEALQEEAFS